MGNTYCSSDWHGCSKPALKLLDYLKPDDTLYFLGDAADRNPDGVMLLEKLLSDPRVKYIKGNHDFYIETCVPQLIKNIENWDLILHYEDTTGMLDEWLHNNGGMVTWLELAKLDPATIMEKFVKPIMQAPVNIYYESPIGHTIYLEHAGCTPWDTPHRSSPWDISHRSHDPLWDREHFYDPWNDEMPDLYVVHGHTPVQYLRFNYGYEDMLPLTKEEMILKYQWWKDDVIYKPKIIKYCNDHKIDVDMCTVASHRVALLNLDTFKEIYFDE